MNRDADASIIVFDKTLADASIQPSSGWSVVYPFRLGRFPVFSVLFPLPVPHTKSSRQEAAKLREKGNETKFNVLNFRAMHGRIFQISTQPVDRDNYIDESTFADGDYSFYDYCANIGDDERIGDIRDLLEYAQPKGMFELTSEDTLLYKGGVERWKEEYVANVRRKAKTLTVKYAGMEFNLLSQTGDKQPVRHRLLFLSRRGDLPV